MNPLYKGFLAVAIYVLYAIQLALLGWMVWGADCQYANTLSPKANLFTLGIVIIISLPYLLAGKRRLFVAGVAGFALGMVILSRIDQSAEKAMNRLADHIQPGMTLTQVEHLAKRQFPKGGRFGSPVWQEISTTTAGSTWSLSTPAVIMVVQFSPDGGVLSTDVSD